MGRYYHGTIVGKFWFGIQRSRDASSFKNPECNQDPKEYLEYYVCGCEVEKTKNLYCNQCYSTYQEHYDDLDNFDKENLNNSDNDNDTEVKDNDNDTEVKDNEVKDNDDEKLLAQSSNHIKYEFDESDLKYMDKVILDLESTIKSEIGYEIGSDIITDLNFTINENDEFQYDIDYDILKNIDENKLEFIARWCFGKQIKRAIEVNDYCTIYCEL